MRWVNTNPNDFIERQIRRTGHYDLSVINAARPFLQGTVVDVGAHIGSWCIPLAQHAHSIIAFEPQPTIHDKLVQNIQANHISNIRTHNIGLSNKKEILPVNLPDYTTSINTGGFTMSKTVESLHKNTIKGKINTGIHPTTLPVTTLDSFQLDNVSLIKIDTEGMELEVLHGATETIDKFSPTIIFECWNNAPWKEKLLDFFVKRHYTIEKICKENYIASVNNER